MPETEINRKEIEMEITDSIIDGILVSAVAGRLTADCAEHFKRYISEAALKNTKIVLDLSKMEYIDSTGLGAIVFSLQKLTDEGGKLKLACLQSKPRIVFNITKAYKIFEIFDSVEAAVEAMK